MSARTVFVTGTTGYIAGHIVQQLLEVGYQVVGSARSMAQESELKHSLISHLGDPSAVDRFQLVPLDLMSDAGWKTALTGADVLMHVASPVPTGRVSDPDAIIRPAVEGAMRAVRAAREAGIRRVVMTSSIAAVLSTELQPGQAAYDEDNWTDLTRSDLNAYTRSKTLAECAVWDWQREEAPEMQITMINPAVALGPGIWPRVSSSLTLISRLMSPGLPFLPGIHVPLVDVRDVAAMHLRAMEFSACVGKRFVAFERSIPVPQISLMLKTAHPDRRMTTRKAPDIVFRALAPFSPRARSLASSLGPASPISAARAERELKISFRDTSHSIRETAAALVQQGLV